METQLKVSFILFHAKKTKTNQTPIYLRIRYNYDHITMATGYAIPAASWDKKSQKVKGVNSEVQTINDGLKALEVKIRSTVNHLILLGKPFNVFNVKDLVSGASKSSYTLNDAFDTYLGMIESLIGKEYAPSTMVKYQQTYSRVTAFAKYKYNRTVFYLNDLDDCFMSDFDLYLRTEFQNTPITIYKHWQRLSRVLRYSIKKRMLDVFPFVDYSIKPPKKRVEYLTRDEIERIETKDFGVDRLNKVADFFIFCIYSGLAYAEVFNLSVEHIVTGVDGQYWIDMYRQKTKKQYSVPLLPKAISIIDKYKNDPFCKKTGKIFPLPTNQKMNAYLKEIQDVCNIKTKLTCHLARKTYSCTILLSNGVSIQVVSQCLGHANINVTATAYASVLPEMVIKEFDMLRKKLN